MKLIQYGALLTALVANRAAAQQQLAFEGAEGYGAYASGGRGGDVYHVTNLEDSGAGSFRDAVSKGNRMVVFDLPGTIHLKSRVDVAANITITGEQLKGEGITISGQAVAVNRVHDVVVRHVKFRGSIDMPRGACTIYADSSERIIFDHVSIEWGRWDNLHIKGSKDITFQYCLIAEAIDPQRFGALIERPERVTIHHCLWMDNQSRNPKAKAKIEYINNVVYNWGGSGFVGGHSADHHYQDIINNYFIAGPNSSENFLSMFTRTDHVYHKGNMVDMNKNGKLDGIAVTDADFNRFPASLVASRQCISPAGVRVETPEKAVEKVMAEAGDYLHRDATDTRLIGWMKSLGLKGEIFPDEHAALQSQP